MTLRFNRAMPPQGKAPRYSHPAETAAPLTPAGYLLSRTLDQRGRIVGFLFAGDPEEPDGSHVCLRTARVHQSVNASRLSDGAVYRSFCDTLPTGLREAMAGIAFAARDAGRGLWPSTEGALERPATIRTTADVEAAVLVPKRFRRLARYFASGSHNLTAFLAWLRAQPGERDGNLVLPSMEPANLHDIISIDGDRIWMTVPSDAFLSIDTPETWRSSLEQPGWHRPRERNRHDPQHPRRPDRSGPVPHAGWRQ
ncbi:MAG: hypothetical protein LJE61_09325 [Thiocapsa sp.]|nr:hypothetical protein [Thiocapsa sp.]MCG6985381.1 hypothetical protein [Thiocapsa sp.]